MAGYNAVLPDCYDVTDRKAVPPEVLRVINIEFRVHFLQHGAQILVGQKRCCVNDFIMVNVRLLSLSGQTV